VLGYNRAFQSRKDGVRKGVGALRKYPWEEWFGGYRFELRRGRDYTCSDSSMAQQIRNQAAERGIRVSIVDQGGSLIVVIRSGAVA